MYENVLKKAKTIDYDQAMQEKQIKEQYDIFENQEKIKPTKEKWQVRDATVHNEDCVIGMRDLEPNSIDLSIFSPPFSQYTRLRQRMESLCQAACPSDDHARTHHEGGEAMIGSP